MRSKRGRGGERNEELMADTKKGSKRPSSGQAKKSAGQPKAKKSTRPKGKSAASKPGKSVTPKAKEPAAKAIKPKTSETAGDLPESNADKAAAGLPNGAGANAALAGKAALEGTRAAGKAVGVATSKAKVPLVAGGGLAAGLAGGLALVRRRNGHRHHGAPDLGPVISAARRAGSFGEELGRVAALVEKASAASKGK
jgi:hypothetical protein